MRHLVLTLTLVATASPALASSIEFVTGLEAETRSVITRSCADCPPPVENNTLTYVVPSLEIGEQSAEVVSVDGEQKIKRIESWLGGSPVVVVTSAKGWETTGSMILARGSKTDLGIDEKATTAAVEPMAPEGIVLQGTAPDVAGFELRLR
ncbi:hypothetical protein FE840_008440 [Peteryoungia desertarenae]|uniref:Secreted protein n=1 Tax=Peteryoungia desertarenae TaxID=1813451 RepID=A0ABX6QLZ6_9HYPH|nr:plant virulence effector HPE1-like domain-containing protein [Peteryoungia desertarenae]QLF69569.1 hypothetical protein FE840_008440 [Peteryoungia desertarenae]